MLRPEPRRPRFERAAVRAMRLTPRDREILRAVRRHRLLRSTHLTALVGGSRQVVLRRLQLLFHHGYLDRPPAQLDWYGRASEPLVYALGQGGANELATAVKGGPAVGRWTTKNRRLSRPFLRHALAVADIMVAFELACRRHEGVSLIQPDEVLARAPEATRRLRLPFRWQVELHEGGRSHRLGVEPDRVFGLRYESGAANRREVFSFLEADRGTMPVVRKSLAQTSLLRKLLAYRETWRQEVSSRRLRIPTFRVLTVTADAGRLARVVAVCRLLKTSGGLFLFDNSASVLPGEDILGQQWVNGRGKHECLLAPLEPC